MAPRRPATSLAFQEHSEAVKPLSRNAPGDPAGPLVGSARGRGVRVERDHHSRQVVAGAPPHRLVDHLPAAQPQVVVVLEPPPREVHGVLAREEVPDAVAADYQELVVLGQRDHLQLWFGAQGPSWLAHLFHAIQMPITERSGHCQLTVQVTVVNVAAK
jgi:hypothetical protein|uniref:Uncharacterized protein n=1 Tax=Zea mays TaxID=4577 RepID=A0A804PPZ0_MAIZE